MLNIKRFISHYPSILLDNFSFFNLDNPFLLVNSLMKFDTLDDYCSRPPVYLAMTQMFPKLISVKANNTFRHHFDIYHYLSLSLFSVSPSFYF